MPHPIPDTIKIEFTGTIQPNVLGIIQTFGLQNVFETITLAATAGEPPQWYTFTVKHRDGRLLAAHIRVTEGILFVADEMTTDWWTAAERRQVRIIRQALLGLTGDDA